MDRTENSVLKDSDDVSVHSDETSNEEVHCNTLDKNVVKALYSRTFGILDNPSRGCEIHALHNGAVIRKGRMCKRNNYVLCGISLVCPACERCLMYERNLQAELYVEQQEAVNVRQRRGSNFASGDSVFAVGGVSMPSTDGSPSSMSSERAFRILAPDAKKWSETDAAGKLYFVLSSCRRKLDKRIELFPTAASKWYLTPREFEKLLFTCGMDWMERDQMDRTYSDLDLNKSGSLHISELCSVLLKAESHCREILRNI